ncbi:hypothetical protein C8R47DRAFT_1217143 [Mycena vitilis]|nr:hypothetical protein C8R47DRAFT_1217143 [Mycena vitilis]
MDKAANSSEKRKKRKDKKKSGKDDDEHDEVAPKQKAKVSAEAKVERDYKRLKSYTDKKAGASAS